MQKVNLYESPRMFTDVYCLLPGQSQKDHTHDANDKVYHVLTGSCTVRIGDETRTLEAGHTAIAPAGVLHGVVNESDDPATLLVFMAPHPRLV
ncbi:MAG: cupin domain-containing protein [Planctomycetes bacterium]|nr:cupin domain-containing protein [Planctomycetota bacterium]